MTFDLGSTTYVGAVGVGSSGGMGGNGHDSDYGDILNEGDGGDGGLGGNGSNVTISMPSGLVIQGPTVFQALGGQGGSAGLGSQGGAHGTGGNGGAGGSLVVGSTNALALGQVTSGQLLGIGLGLTAAGGNGAAGVVHNSGRTNLDGGDGGNGGAGGSAQLVFGGTVGGILAGIVVDASGGDGGAGGKAADLDDANGGNGGNGGAGGRAVAVFAAGAQWAPGFATGTGILATSHGGQGGAGGKASQGSGGIAGTGANAGFVYVQNDGAIQTGHDDSPGILAQAFGGAGANGGKGGGWGASGGFGGTGGTGGIVNIMGGATGSIVTTGINAQGIIAQSIGGGGGSGGDSDGWMAVGGDGGVAANGGDVNVITSNTITTAGERAGAIVAQSIGGGGGNGGRAKGFGGGLDFSIGGTGGGGGDAGQVVVASSGTIATSGLHASGLLLQAIGGGGGNGGAAYATTGSVVGSAAVSIGGAGGNGGDGGVIALVGGSAPTNSGQIQTMGNNAHGLVAQSIGGGGGIGGLAAATATSVAVPAENELPSVSLAVGLGGQGGNGGHGNIVTVSNAGLVTTGGAGSIGMLVQSVGGGGGAGGDATASASAQGSGAFNLTATFTLGGTGGGGGHANSVTALNSGLIVTAGGSADGMLVQSIGGGGGAGGIADASASSDSNADYSVSVTLGMGGGGGAGGNGGAVIATNSGAILTMGDGSVGIMAQSIGGGGGKGGGAGGGASGSFSATVMVGGDGGKGGGTPQDANGVTVTNSGTIVTFGADAAGIHAQSIAGGGGAGGKTGSNIGSKISRGDGGVGVFDTVYGSFNGLATAYRNIKGDPNNPNSQNPAAAYNNVVGLLGIGAGVLGVSGNFVDNLSGLENLAGELGSLYQGDYSPTLAATIGVGGKGGAGGTAGGVTVINTASIGTMGSMSDAIIAQSIGGGGGKGGASSTNSAAQTDAQSEVSVGGRGGAGGAGSNVTVTNSGEIITIGGHSAGIVAQSIGGGGGIGGVAGVTSSSNPLKSLLSVPVAVGGNGGSASSAGDVTITNSASITTLSHNSIGIIAQSIAGGGGIVKSFSLSAGDNNGGGASVTGGSFGIDGFQFGGAGGASGSAGQVTVSHLGSTISTAGRNAYGILAQSIGGGGGLSIGGMPNGTSFFGSGTMSGSGDTVSVTLGDGTTPASIVTTGQGAVGIFAQSIGGGGGVAGDTALLSALMSFTESGLHIGNGGTVAITVNAGASVATGAESTPAILAQSIGAGGGRVTNTSGAYSGSVRGLGVGGLIDIDIGGTVSAAGLGSPAIYAESAGFAATTPASSPISVTVDPGAAVSGGTDVTTGDGTGAGIYLVGGGVDATTLNSVTNFGTITSVNGASGTAIYGTGGNTQVTNESGGTITGNINLANGGGSGNVTNNGGGTLNTGAQVALGRDGILRNRGTLQVGEPRQLAATTLTGTLLQEAGGRLVFDTDHAAGRGDMLTVKGQAVLAGRIEAKPITLSNTPVTVMTASNGITLDPAAIGYRSHVFDLKPVSDGNSLRIQPSADFFGSGRLGAAQRQVASHLQEAWNNGESLGTGFAALAGVKDGGSYARALDTLSGQTVGAIAASRFATSQAFVSNMQSCPDLIDPSPGQRERDCVWGRVIGNTAVQDAMSDSLGYRASTVTAQIGGQHEFRPDWFIGGSLAYESSRLSGSRGAATVTGDSVLAGLVLKHQRGGWLFSGAIDAGYGSYDSARQIVLGDVMQAATGEPTAWHLGATARLSYRFEVGNWYVKPMAELRVAHMVGNAYTERGASPFRLAVAEESATMLTGTGAVEIGTRIGLGSFGTLLPFVSLGLSVSGDDGWAATARFAGAQGATAGFRATTPIPTTVGRVSVGANLATAGNLEVKLQYNGDFGDRYSSHTGLARIAYRF